MAVSGSPSRARRRGAQVVALDVRDAGVEAEAVGDLAHRVGEAGRVEPAGVGDDPHAALEREAEAVLDLAHEGARVAERRVLQLVAAEDQHGQLGEVVAGQHVELAAVEHLAHRREPVAVEAGAVADPQQVGRSVPSAGSAPVARRAGERLRDVEPAVGVGAGRRPGRCRRGGGAG